MSDNIVIVCIGRRRLEVAGVGDKVQLKITLGAKPLAHLVLERGEAEKLHGEIGYALEYIALNFPERV